MIQAEWEERERSKQLLIHSISQRGRRLTSSELRQSYSGRGETERCHTLNATGGKVREPADWVKTCFSVTKMAVNRRNH